METKRKLYPNTLTNEYLNRIVRLAAKRENPTETYRRLNNILREILDLLTANVPYTLSGTYAKVGYVIDVICPQMATQVRKLRFMCRYPETNEKDLEPSLASNISTIKALALLLSQETVETAAVTQPKEQIKRTHQTEKHSDSPWVICRVSVAKCASISSVEVVDIDTDENITIDLSKFEYMSTWLRRGTRINLIYYKKKEGNDLNLVIYEPDYLVDVTQISSCFTAYAVTHKLSIIKKLELNQATKHTLLGNYSGQFLDEALTNLRKGGSPCLDYKQSAIHFFKANAISLATTEGIDSEWHKEAKAQQVNVTNALLTLQKADTNFNAQIATTEASIICAALGLRGRTDLMQSDFRFLIEQKSGKMETFAFKGPKEEHYIQMMLYKTMLSVGFGDNGIHSSRYFLYSKYEPQQGLIREGASMSDEQTKTVMAIRNSIVHDQFRYTNPAELSQDLLSWNAEQFRQRQVSDRLWEPYSKPELESVLLPIQMADQLTQAYFFEMLAFLIREDLSSRIGGTQHGREGYANIWNSSNKDREAAGEMLMGLQFAEMRRDEIEDGEDEMSIVIFSKTIAQDYCSEPNFRVGDPVTLYDYAEKSEPNVLKTIAYRATLINIEDKTSGDGIRAKRLTIKLRSAQTPSFFNKADRRWALEHDHLEAGTTRQASQMANLLRTTQERKNLLMGLRQPVVNPDKQKRIGEYGAMNELVDKELAARDMFLLVGPPGTGKTSVGLMNILREELAHKGHNVLLLSYTNRAVDEICSKLEKDRLDYIRIGSRYACAESYQKRLLMTVDFPSVEAVRQKISGTRIFVGTTMSISGSVGLFKLKKFDLAIVDEASQILEPSIIGILSEANKYTLHKEVSIERFVLIGDQKQLPAVVQQNRSQSAVKDKRLSKIRLSDCRNSFFERMIELYGSDDKLVYSLTKHGRMHPEVADFCNRHFYGNRLRSLALPHQTADLGLKPEFQQTDRLTQLIATRRTLFINSHTETPIMSDEEQDKVNIHEADIITELALKILQVRQTAGKEIKADVTLGIVVPYRSQIAAIRTKFIGAAGKGEMGEMAKRMTIDTVERLQGSERDIIIYGFSVTKASQLEFLKDSQYKAPDGTVVDRKLNVALSRAKEQIFVVGDLDIISQDPLFAELSQEMNKGL